MIRALVFDCFGVLYHGSLAHMYELIPVESHTALRDLNHASDRGFISIAEYIDGVAELSGQSPEEIRRIMKADHIRNQPLLDYLEKFRGQYKTALLSNVGTDVMSNLFTAEEFKKYFDVVVLSSEVGMVKPFAEIYTYAAAELHVQPSECVMIDDLQENIDGARAAGRHGIVYHTQPQLAHDLHRLGIFHA